MKSFFKLYPLSASLAKQYGTLSLNAPGNIHASGTGENNYCCWNCGDLLIKDIDQITFGNLAIRCKRCEVFNLASKKWENNDKPPYLQLMDKTCDNKIAVKTFTFWAQSPDKDELFPLSQTLIANWVKYHQKPPSVLQHYTSFPGLSGIISSSSLWLTDVAYMNDASELIYGRTLINDYISSKMESVGVPSKELLRRSMISQTPHTTSTSYFICCFCGDGDLLSQWRAYGAGGNGYSIGFSTNDIVFSPKLQLRKVIYDPAIQKQLIEHVVDRILMLFSEKAGNRSIKELDDSFTLPYFAAFMENHLTEFLFTFKHKSFQEENEWRVITEFEREKDLPNLRFRNQNGTPVPYLQTDLRMKSRNMTQIPIVSITHGPTLMPLLTSKSLSLLLEANGYTFTEVFGSETPLRL